MVTCGCPGAAGVPGDTRPERGLAAALDAGALDDAGPEVFWALEQPAMAETSIAAKAAVNSSRFTSRLLATQAANELLSFIPGR
jgi:hypothetical protein